MFELALAIGIYSYLILILGLLGNLYLLPAALVTLFFWGLFLWFFFKKRGQMRWVKGRKLFASKLTFLIVLLFFIQAIINLIGALGPELSFDALWYHLTLPKLYVSEQGIFHLPGGLLCYSAMPRLTEMLYTAALIFKDEILAKLIHWLFGFLTAVALFRLLRRFLNDEFSLLGTTIFYTLLVVGWQSTTAYIDLARTFFEILALAYFLRWLEKKGNWLLKSSLMMGFSLSTKLLSLETLFIFLISIFVFSREKLRNITQFLGVSLGVVLPWYILAYFNTGNPFYPLFTGWFERGQIGDWRGLWRPSAFLASPWQVTFHLDNLMTPVFLIFLPLVLIKIWQQDRLTKTVGFYSLLGFIFWVLSPPFTARYLLPFVPALILIYLKIITSLNSSFQKVAIVIIIFTCLLNLGSRVMATKKFLPVVLGRESKEAFLIRNLNFDYGDFYDVDGFFKENIDENDLVLIYNIHNLYYIDFPFVHESWAKPGTYFSHILVKEMDLPKKFGDLELIYENSTVKVRLYRYGAILE